MFKKSLMSLVLVNFAFTQEIKVYDLNITQAYYELKFSFNDSYYLPENLPLQSVETDLEQDEFVRDIYGYKKLSIVWKSADEVIINLYADDSGERICTNQNHQFLLKQTKGKTQLISQSSSVYPKDISDFIKASCDCEYYRGEPKYDEARQNVLENREDYYCQKFTKICKKNTKIKPQC